MTKKTEHKIDVEKIRKLIGLNFDARNYFFSKADERWLSLLWENGLLDEIKKKSNDPTRYSYRMPELDYLARMAEKIPAEVTDIMLAAPISIENFNPEVVDRFLWISSKLPAKELARLVPKILNDKWASLMGPFNRLGFEYEKIFAALLKAKDFESILIVARVALTLKSGEETVEKSGGFGTDNRFLLTDLSYTKVFEYIVAVDDDHLEKAMDLILRTLSGVTSSPAEEDPNRIFKVGDTFHLYDVDFFTLEPNEGQHYSYRDDVRELAATAKVLVERTIATKCADGKLVKRIYEQYIKTLPDSRSMWRFRLYAISLCPEVFKEEIKEEIFKIFKYERPGDLLIGAEYERLIQIGLPILVGSDQRVYITKVTKWFNEEEWKESGHDILSAAFPVMTAQEKKIATEAFGSLDEKYIPQASIGHSMVGTVVSRAPGTEEQWKQPVPELIGLFKGEWSPENLKRQPEREDYFHPVDAEGARDRLKLEMATRPSEFLDNAELFFDRTSLGAHYTYAFIRNLSDLIKEKKIPDGVHLDKVFSLLEAIIKSALKSPFEHRMEGKKDWYWVGDWDSVNNSMADLAKSFLGEGVNQSLVNFIPQRGRLLMVIDYVLHINDPEPKDEEIETAKHKTKSSGDEDYMVGDPFTTAINSVRGQAFQALVTFTFLDAKKFSKDAKSKIELDVKAVYEWLLSKEDTRAIMFMFGHYLPTFYFGDRVWIESLLPQIFPSAPKKRHLYLAAWEGYISNNLFEEIFFDPQIQKLYEVGLTLTGEEDKHRKYFKEFDEGLSTHLALAFMYYENFGFDHPLFKAFWSGDVERQAEFISFIGRMFISGNNTGANKLLSTEPRSKQRLKELWDWILKNCTGTKIFGDFGFWISLEKDIFDVVWLAAHVRQTLEKSKGFLGWDYGLEKTIIQFAKVAPQDTLTILNLYFLDGGIRSTSQRRMPLRTDAEWYEVFELLSKNSTTKAGISSLINILIRDGGSSFWNLRPLLK